MNTPNNKRRRESRERIESVFVELLQTKELSEISVSDICKRTQLNRSTFYANYNDIYDLADAIRVNLEQQVESLYTDGEASLYSAMDFAKLLCHIRDNQLFYKTYFKLGYDRSAVVDVSRLMGFQELFEDEHLLYHIEFFRAGFNAIIKMWLRDGCVEPPEVIGAILINEYKGRVRA